MIDQRISAVVAVPFEVRSLTLIAIGLGALIEAVGFSFRMFSHVVLV